MDSDPKASLQTRWSMIDQLTAKDADTAWTWFVDRYRPFAREVLSGMMRNRAKGLRAEEEFWAYFFQARIHEKANRDMRFRGYLAGVLRRYAMEWSRKDFHAQSSDEDATSPEPAYLAVLPEDEEMRIFAMNVVHIVLRRFANGTDLDGKAAGAGSPATVALLRAYFGIPDEPGEPAKPRLQISEVKRALRLEEPNNNITNRIARAKPRLRALATEEIRQTVPDGSDFETELNLIFEAIHKVVPGLLDL